MNPQKIGRYEIREELGRGGMATVYRGYDPLFEREVAVKVLPREMLHDPHFRIRFEREAKTIALLEHSAIVTVYDFGEEDGQPYFVMRYMAGGSLSDRIKKGPLSIKQAAAMFERLAPALDDAHTKNIIHRDLKPGNILYDKHDDPYISDFGIAKLTEGGGTNVTGSAIIGTPAYMSPEQAQGEVIDSRADIYALGVILFEMLSGKEPYEADTPMGVVIKHITDQVPHILDVKPDLPPAIEAVIEKAMAKNRNERYATAGDMADALLAVAREIEPDLPGATRIVKQVAKADIDKTLVTNSPPPLAKKKKNGLWLALGIFVILTMGGLAALIFGVPNLHLLGVAPATNTPTVVSASSTSLILLPTNTVSLSNTTPTVMSLSTEPVISTATSTQQALPVLGGADQVAFVANKNIWIMNVDGSNLRQLTNDTSLKTNLQWIPSGEGVLYLTGKCVRQVDAVTTQVSDLTCFPSSQTLDAFKISPDASQVAISIDHILFIVPFNLPAIQNAHNQNDLVAMKGCFNGYKANLVTSVQWSPDGSKVALGIWGVEGDHRIDMVRELDISKCDKNSPILVDDFPASFFTMDGYTNNPVIPSFSWDGHTLFLLNSPYFNGIFGPLYKYNTNLHKAEKINPVDNVCCYLDTSWSPDYTYLIFAFSDFRKGGGSQTELYYIPFGTIGTGDIYAPIPLPAGFFTSQSEEPWPVLRPVKQ